MCVAILEALAAQSVALTEQKRQTELLRADFVKTSKRVKRVREEQKSDHAAKRSKSSRGSVCHTILRSG